MAGQPATLLGYSVIEFEDMPDIAADSLSIAFGDMNEAYQIVDRVGVRVLRDPYTAKPYIKFYTTKRVGGDVLNFEAIKLISFSA
jgi:HK97 family phage major capsid protein